MIFAISLLLIFACSRQKSEIPAQNIQQNTIPVIPSDDVSKLTPREAVILYFQAWHDEQYDVMYSLISDGFKQIEPTARAFNDFKQNMEKFYGTANSIRLMDAKEEYHNDNEAGIGYKIEIENKDNTKKEFSSAYTLKKRENGWKLIHPYGKNIDTS